ncbi:hypothetical protein G6F59_016924 [Rhizopus arrhizus]|nr:hypothetical protein G6F59_016924 [Rhizopus arrhizus]
MRAALARVEQNLALVAQTQRDADRFQTYLRLFGGGRVLDNGELEAPGGRRRHRRHQGRGEESAQQPA